MNLHCNPILQGENINTIELQVAMITVYKASGR